jgi:hypothetical protein
MIELNKLFDATTIATAVAVIAFVIFYFVARKDLKEMHKD